MLYSQSRKLCFAALIVVVEVDEESDYTLAAACYLLFIIRNMWIDEVEVFGYLFTWRVMQHGCNFKIADGCAETVGHAVLQQNVDEVGIKQFKTCGIFFKAC